MADVKSKTAIDFPKFLYETGIKFCEFNMADVSSKSVIDSAKILHLRASRVADYENFELRKPDVRFVISFVKIGSKHFFVAQIVNEKICKDAQLEF